MRVQPPHNNEVPVRNVAAGSFIRTSLFAADSITISVEPVRIIRAHKLRILPGLAVPAAIVSRRWIFVSRVVARIGGSGV
jgi:hypothetical protein